MIFYSVTAVSVALEVHCKPTTYLTFYLGYIKAKTKKIYNDM